MPDRIRDTKATETGIETVQMVAMYQSQFWPSLYPKDAHQGYLHTKVTMNIAKYLSRNWQQTGCGAHARYANPRAPNLTESDPKPDVVRYYQASQLKENHKMVKVMVYREKLSKSFENQVIAT